MLLYQIPHNAYTEVEYLYVSGKWSLPAVTGTTPPPLEGFSFTKVDHRRAVVYGGTTRGIQALGDAYVLQLDTWVCVSPRVYNRKSVQLPYGFYTRHLDRMT